MEYIKNIEIKNFKSIRHQIIEGCKRVNVFIGYPNTGKSNILESLGLYGTLLLQKGENFRLDNICRVKHFSELYFNQEYRLGSDITVNKEFNLNLELLNNAQSLQLRFSNQQGKVTDIYKDPERDRKLVVDQSMNVRIANTSILPLGRNTDVPSVPIKKYSFTNETVGANVESLSLNIPFGNNLLDVLQREASLRRDIGEVLSSYGFKLLLDTATGTMMLIKEIDESSVLRIPYHQIADTLQRLIFYKAAIVSNKNTVLLFEEPEAHMFPPYISKFTSEVMYNENGNQFFINTHSPFVVNDFMENLKQDELSIYVIGYKKETGETIARRLNDKEMHEIYQYGTDLFLNLENYLYHEQ